MPSIAQVLRQGLAADKPTPDATLNQGWLYYETDTNTLKQSWNGVWVDVSVPPPAGSAAFVKLGEVIVGVGGQQTFTFSSIPGGLASLELVIAGRSDGAAGTAYCVVQFNGDTNAANYNSQYGYFENYVSGQVAGTSALNTSRAGAYIGWMGGTDQADVLDTNYRHVRIPDYDDTTRHKVVKFAGAALAVGDYEDLVGTAWWLNTAAITDIVVHMVTDKLIEGSTVRLYGVE